MQRTIRVILEPTVTQASMLEDTCLVFTSAFNQAVDIGWQAQINNATKLHCVAYYAVKYAHPTLVSALVNQARVKAAEALRSAFTLQKHDHTVSKPHSAHCPPRYNTNTYRVDWDSRTVRLSTTQGDRPCAFVFLPTRSRTPVFPSIRLTCSSGVAAGICISS